MERSPEKKSWLSTVAWTFVCIPIFMLLEMLPLIPVSRAAWGALFWISVLLSAAAWLHFEAIGFPNDDAPSLTQWLHGLPWLIVALLLFFGQDWWWADFMQRNFRALW